MLPDTNPPPIEFSSRSLTDRVVVVTGSSTGIGRATAWECARRGARVILHGRTPSEALLATEREMRAAGHPVLAIPCDLAVRDGLEAFVADCWDSFGGVDTWINNAGADVLTGGLAGASFEDKLKVLWEVDVVATTLLSREAGRRMQACSVSTTAAGHFSLINMGWDQAWQGMEGDSGQLFGITKGAVMTFTLSLAQELAPRVRVNAVAPGWIGTEWSESAEGYWQNRACSESLMHRWGSADDVARVMAFLAGPESSFVSGQIWRVNGGFRFGVDAGRDRISKKAD